MFLCAVFVLTRLRMAQVRVETCSVNVRVINGIKKLCWDILNKCICLMMEMRPVVLRVNL
jgi:hypothetical protein